MGQRFPGMSLVSYLEGAAGLENVTLPGQWEQSGKGPLWTHMNTPWSQDTIPGVRGKTLK